MLHGILVNFLKLGIGYRFMLFSAIVTLLPLYNPSRACLVVHEDLVVVQQRDELVGVKQKVFKLVSVQIISVRLSVSL